jgi:hypothetical protein
MKKHNNNLQVQTNAIQGELTPIEINEIARGVSFYYKNGRFTCQSFFTPPRIGEINWVDGIEKEADVCFRSIRLIGNNLFHVHCMGSEKKVRQVCAEPMFFQMLRALSSTLSESVKSRVYLDVTDAREKWDAIVSLDKQNYYLANYVDYEGKKMRIKNITIVGDRLLGLTEEGRIAVSQLTPEIFEKENYRLEVALPDEFSASGKIDTLAPVPNSEISFMASAQNNIYEFDIHGNRTRFQSLDDRVKQINHIDFNRVRSLFSTNEGLYEIDVEELPQMVRSTSLPRLISHPELKGSFTAGHYVEDPYVLGVNPGIGIVAKTQNDKVVCF